MQYIHAPAKNFFRIQNNTIYRPLSYKYTQYRSVFDMNIKYTILLLFLLVMMALFLEPGPF